jgi:hypothetical protein
MPGKRVQFDDETWQALDLLARDRMQDFQELADEAFRDLLQKHGRPTDLKTALRRSAGIGLVAEKPPKKTKGRAKRLPRLPGVATPSTCSRHACGLLPSQGTMRPPPS